MQLIVLGMHRSGTSVLARTLNLMGAYFGNEGTGTGANDENPKGFWERRDVRVLNDSVLHAVGADWNRVAGFEVEALPPDVVEEFTQRASRLVLELDAHRPWFIKEPRLCLLLPLWRRVLELPVVVQIHRHPVEVAASLHTRNAIPIPTGIALWEKYVRAASRAAEGLPGARVSHRGLVTRPTEEVERLYRQLVALGVQGLRLPSETEVAAFVDQALYRERESREDLRGYSRAPQVALFEEIQAGARPVAPMSDAALQPLRDYEATLPPLQPKADAAKSARALEAELHERVGAREQEAKSLRNAIAKLEASLGQRDESLAAERIAIGKLTAEAGVRERALAALEAACTERERQVDALEATVTSRERDIVALRVELEGAGGRLAALAGDLDASRKLGVQGEATLARREAEIESLRHRLAESTRRFEDAERRLERAERSLSDRFDEIAALTRLLLARDAAIEQARKELAASEGQLRTSAAELDLARTELARIHASRSWRLAAPLRALVRLAGRGKRSPEYGGELALVEASGLFDRAWYLNAYPDVARSGIDPLEHYLVFGGFEQRSPGPGFNAADYLRLNPDVAEARLNPLVHYLHHGRGEGRRLA